MKNFLVFSCMIAFALVLNACNRTAVDPAASTGSARSGNPDSLTTGGPRSFTTIAVANLPTAVTTYITTNYAGATIREAAKDGTGNYLVAVLVDSKLKLLTFKADGTFIKALGGKPAIGDSSNHHKPAPGDTARHSRPGSTTVAVASLPAAIGAYVSTNYSGATIERAGQEGSNKDYLVAILTADKKRVLLLFGLDGTFKKVLTRR